MSLNLRAFIPPFLVATIFPSKQLRSRLGAPKSFFLLFFIFILNLLSPSELFGQGVFRSVASGNWSTAGTWALDSGVDGDGIPDANDNVYIVRNTTVTITANASCTTLQIGGTAANPFNQAGTLNFSGAFSLTVSGSVTVGGAGFATRTGTLTFSSGSSITAGSLIFGNAGATPGTPNSIDMTSGGTLTTGSLTVNTGGGTITNNWTQGTGTVVLNTTNTLPTSVFTSFNNLTINGGTTTMSGALSIGGTLNVNNGTFALSTFNVTSVSAVTMNGTSITGTGTLTLAGDVTTLAAGTVSTISAPIAVGASDRTFNVDDSATVPDLNITGAISGAAGIIKTGIGSLNLSNGTNSYGGTTTASQGTLRIAVAGGAIPNGSALTVNSTFDLNGNNETVGSIAGSGTITSGAAGSIALTSGGDNSNTIFSGVVQNGSGTVALTKAGSGTLTLSGNNTYTGLTTISAGTLKLGSTTALGSTTGATSITSGAVLDLNGINYASAEGLTINGTGISSNGAVINSSATGATYGGLIALGSASSIVGGTGTIAISNAGTITGTFGLTLGGAQGGTMTSIIGTGANTLTKIDAGAWTLSGANTYSGTTDISAGTLKLGSTTALGSTAGTTAITSGAVLDLNGINYASAEGLTINGTGISSNGAVINSSATGATYGGLLTLGSASSIVGGTGTIAISNAGTITGAFGLTLGGAQGGTMTSIIGTGANTLTKIDAGTWTLSGANTYTGATNINAGTLRLGSADRIPDASAVTVTGTFDLNGNNETVGSIAGSGTITSGAAGSMTLTSGGDNSDTIFSGVVQNGSGTAVALTKAGSGTLTLSGNNTFTGLTTISAGTLKLGSTTALGSTAGATSITSGAVLDLNGINYAAAEGLTINGTGISSNGAVINSSATGATYGGLITLGSASSIVGGTGTIAISNAGTITGAFGLTLGGAQGGTVTSIIGTGANTLTKIDAGTWTLSGANTYTGATNISAGTLRLGSADRIPDASAVTVTGTLDLNGFSETIGLLAGGGTVTSGAAGAITLTSGGDGSNTTYSGVVQNGSGTVALTKAGSGTLTLSGNNTYTGLTTISAGTLKLGSATALGSTAGATSITSGAVLDLNGINYAAAESLTLNGTGIAAGGSLINTNASAAAYAGAITTGSASTITTTNDINVTGTLISTFDLTKDGAGTLNLGSNAITLNNFIVNTGTLTSTSGTLGISGSFTNGGTFAHNGGTVDYNGGAAQTLASVSYNNIVLSGVGQKNASGAVSVSGNLNNSAVFDMGSNTLSVSGTTTNTGTIRFSGASNGLPISTGTIEYYGASQTIGSGTYNNLIINQSGGEAVLGGDVTVNATLTLSARNLNLNGYNLTLGSAAPAISGGPFSASKMIIATGGSELRKIFSGIGQSFDFPVGDNTGALEYSPATVTVNAGTFGTPYIGVSVMDAKHPNNASTTHFLSRYWTINNSGITSISLTTSYLAADINGTEGSISSAQLRGTFDVSASPWLKLPAPNGIALAGNTLGPVTATLGSGQISSFTGITLATPTVSITNGATASVCNGSSLALTTSVVGGDPVVTYSWSPVTGLNSSTIANPTFTASVVGGPTSYVFTVTDGNGITSTDQIDITVSGIPASPAVTFSPSSYCVNTVVSVVPPFITAPVGGSTYQWYSDAGLTSLLTTSATPTNAQLGFDNTFANSKTVYVTETNSSGCRGAATTVTLTVNSNPVADAGAASVTICDGLTTTLGGAPSATGGGGSYTYSWSPNTGLNNAFISNPVFTSSGSVSQAYTLTVTDVNGCQGTDVITVNVTVAPAAPAVTFSPSTYCVGSVITPPTAVGTALQWWSDAALTNLLSTSSPTNPTNAELGFSTASAGVITVYVTQTVGGCRGVASVVTLNVLTTLTASLVSDDADNVICAGANVRFTATPAGGNYDFRINGGPPVQIGASNIFNSSTLASGDQVDAIVSIGGCISTSAAITITVNPAPTVSAAGPDQSVCITGGIPATLAGNVPVVGSGLWSIVSGAGGSFGLASDPGSSFSGAAGTTYVLRWTISNGVCASSSDDVTMVINADPSVSNAGPDQTGVTAVCGTSATLAGNVPVIGTGTWSVIAGAGGSFVNANSATTVFNGTAGVTYTLRWTISNGVCTSSIDEVDISLQQAPTVSAAGPEGTHGIGRRS